MTTRKKVTYISVLLIVFLVFPYLYGQIMLTVRYKAVESNKISEQRDLALALELFYDANGKYPPTGICMSVSALEPFLKEYVPQNYLYQEDSTPMKLWEKLFYPRPENFSRVSTNADGTSYVLLTRLSKMDNSVLQKDLDGLNLGCDCDDPNFCTGPDFVWQ